MAQSTNRDDIDVSPTTWPTISANSMFGTMQKFVDEFVFSLVLLFAAMTMYVFILILLLIYWKDFL